MRVLCKRIINPVTNQTESRDPWLTVGKEYQVLSIVVHLQRNILFQLISDDVSKVPVMFTWDQFEIVDARLPSRWVVSVDPEFGEIRFAPSKWLRPGFWDSYFDGNQDAIDDFDLEIEAIFRESNG